MNQQSSGSGPEAVAAPPLAGVRVLEVCTGGGGAFCARVLGDLGADVVALRWPSESPRGVAAEVLDLGKEVVTVDLADLGPEPLDDLLRSADVVVEDLPAGLRRRLGLDAGRLEDEYRSLVVVSVSPYGRSGPWAERPGSDITASAASSLTFALGDPGRHPLRIPFDQAELHAATHAAAAAVTALYAREGSGRGQHVDVGASRAMGYEVGGMHLVYAKGGRPWERTGRIQHSGAYPIGFFEASDGYICTATQQPKHWERWLQMAADAPWADRPDLQDGSAVAADPGRIDPLLRDWMRRFTRSELLAMALEHDIVLGVVNRFDELFQIEHFGLRHVWVPQEVEGTAVQVPRTVAWPVPVSGTRPATTGTAGVGARWRQAAPHASAPDAEGSRPALEGVRILDFGWNWAGPMAAQLLADMGAEVIKVESGRRQDLMRYLPEFTWFYEHNHRNKRSITVDLAEPAGREALLRLVPHVDVVMNNFAAGVMDRLGLGYAELRSARADVINVSMSMAGQHGPLSPMRGFASIATGFAGLEPTVGYEGADGMSVGLMQFGLGDTALGVQGALATVSALLHRRRTGEGQNLDLSQVEAVLTTMGGLLAEHQVGHLGPPPYGNRDLTASPHGVFAAAGDDAWVAISVRTEAEWRALCTVIGHPAWATRPRPEHGSEMAHAVRGALADWCRDQDRDQASDTLARAGVPSAPVLRLEERDAHESFADVIRTVEHSAIDPSSGPFAIYDTPWRLSRSTRPALRPAPVLGEANRDVFVGLGVMDDAELERLVAEGVIA